MALIIIDPAEGKADWQQESVAIVARRLGLLSRLEFVTKGESHHWVD